MIYGAHALIYSRLPAEARAVLNKLLSSNKVYAWGGWTIFALPPAEIAVHPTDGAPRHDLYLMCQDIEETIQELRSEGVTFSKPVSEERWGRTTAIALPGGGELGLYQPRHPTALQRPSATGRTSRAGSTAARKKAPAKASKARASRR